MSYEILLAASARRDLERVPPRIVSAIVEFLYGDLAQFPRKVSKPLRRELEGLHSARRGPYRILFSINDDERRVDVLRIDHRSDIYRAD